MASANSRANGADEDDSCCLRLQEQVHNLEQGELSQMRQSAILQRKLDSAEQRLRELQQQRHRRCETVARRAHARSSAGSPDHAWSDCQAARALEAELTRQLDLAFRREGELEHGLRRAEAQRGQLRRDLGFWRRCGQAALEDERVGRRGRGTEAAPVASHVAEFKEGIARLTLETCTLKESCKEVSARFWELERIAEAAHSQHSLLLARNGRLTAAATAAGAALTAARERGAAARRREQQLREEASATEANMAQVRQAPGLISGSTAGSMFAAEAAAEAARLRVRLREQQQEAQVLREEGARLQAALLHHTGLERQHGDGGNTGAVGAPDSGAGGPCKPLDELMAWFVMSLFKSIFVRRAFCTHLVVLYSWLLFLLWYMSARGRHR